MRLMVGHDGTQCQACLCPGDEMWREYLAQAYRLYATTRPAVLWVEDDFRHFNHRPVDLGCFCEAHLQAFSERVGEPVTREALVHALVAPGKPHPWREAWLDLQGEEMIEVAEMLEQAVHEVSAGTRLGLMTSRPDWHAVEGRRWHELLQTLAGPHEPVCRPHYVSYTEQNPQGMLQYFVIGLQTMCHLPAGTRSCPELENHPHTRFSKSVRGTRLHLVLGSMVSTGEITLNILDTMPNALADEGYGEMLAATKPFLGEIAQARDGAIERGVRLISDERASYYVQTSGHCDLRELLPHSSGWAWPLSAVGIPITYEPAEDPVALTGQTIRAFSEGQIQQILSGGVLVDLSALETLTDMGWGEMLGVERSEVVNQIDSGYSRERIVDPHFALAGSNFLSLNGASARERMGKISPHPDAKIISEFAHYDENIPALPGVILFENTLGGRVAVQALDLSEGTGPSFFKASRPRQLATIVQWLGRGALALWVQGGPYLLARRWDQPERTTVAIINGSLDSVDALRLILAEPNGGVTSVRVCTSAQGWQPIAAEQWDNRDGHVQIKVPGSLSGWDSVLVSLLPQPTMANDNRTLVTV